MSGLELEIRFFTDRVSCFSAPVCFQNEFPSVWAEIWITSDRGLSEQDLDFLKLLDVFGVDSIKREVAFKFFHDLNKEY